MSPSAATPPQRKGREAEWQRPPTKTRAAFRCVAMARPSPLCVALAPDKRASHEAIACRAPRIAFWQPMSCIKRSYKLTTSASSPRPSTNPSPSRRSCLSGTSMAHPPVKPPAVTPTSTFAPSPSTRIHSAWSPTSLSCARHGTQMEAPTSSTTAMRLPGSWKRMPSTSCGSAWSKNTLS